MIEEYKLINKNGISIVIISLGGIIKEINTPSSNGKFENIVLGYKDNNKYLQPLKTWVPSIGISAVKIYYGNEFPHWNGMFIIGSLKKQSLEVFELKNNKLINNSSIIKNKIGRVRDIEINASGQILLLSDDKSALWILKK